MYNTTHDPHPRLQLDAPAGGVMLTSDDFAEVMRELDALRNAHRSDIAERLRDARAYGTAVNDDDHLAVLEDAAVEWVKIARLERLVASATVIDAAVAGDGVAGLGSVVLVRDPAGQETEYELVGRRGADASRTQVTLASPVGQALRGARSGDSVRVPLPSGRERTLTVLAIRAQESDVPPPSAQLA